MIRAFNSSVRLGMKLTPDVLALVQAFREWMLEQGRLLALLQEPAEKYLHVLDDRLLQEKGLERAKVDAIVSERAAVRLAKDFKRSDELRDDLLKLGIAIQDTPQGTTWEVAK